MAVQSSFFVCAALRWRQWQRCLSSRTVTFVDVGLQAAKTTATTSNIDLMGEWRPNPLFSAAETQTPCFKFGSAKPLVLSLARPNPLF